MHSEPTQQVPSAALAQLAELPQVTGAYASGADGFLLDAITVRRSDAEQVAALAAIVHGATGRSGFELDLGALRWIVLEMQRGNAVLIQASPEVLLTVTTDKRAALGGVLHLAAKTANRPATDA